MTHNNTKLDIKHGGPATKRPLTHFETYCEEASKFLSLDLREALRIAVKGVPDFLEKGIDDRPFMAMSLLMLKRVLAHLMGNNLDAVARSRIEAMTIQSIYQSDEAQRSEFRSFLNSLFHVYHFSKSRMLFRIEEPLMAKLLYTDINKVDSLFVKSPFSSIFIQTPYNNEIFIPHKQLGSVRMAGFYLMYTEEVSNLQENMKGSEVLSYEGTPCNKALRILAVGDTTGTTLSAPNFFMTLFFAPGDVFPQVERTVSIFSEPGEFERSKDFRRKLFRFCVNALLYISNPRASLVQEDAKFEKTTSNNAKEREKVRKKNQGLSKLPVILTGSNVYISSEYRKQFREGTLGSLPSSRTEIGVPVYMVRGHYRNQPHGPGRSLSSLIWIEPYVKGKGILNDPLERTYHVT